MLLILLGFVTLTVVLVQLRFVAFVRGYLGKNVNYSLLKRCFRRLQLWSRRQKTWFKWRKNEHLGTGFWVEKKEKIGSGEGGGGGNRGRATSTFPMSLPHATSSRFLAPFAQTQSLFICYSLWRKYIHPNWRVLSLSEKSTLTNLFNYSFYSDEGVRMAAEKTSILIPFRSHTIGHKHHVEDCGF